MIYLTNPPIYCRAQTQIKARLAGAVKGHSLLKKKAEALQMRFRQILGKIVEVSLIDTYLFCILLWNDFSIIPLFQINDEFNKQLIYLFSLDKNIDGRSDERRCILSS